MKNKLLLLCFICITLICGCSIVEKNYIKELTKKIENCDSYHMKATLEIYRNEEKFTYDIDSSYEKDDKFKVSLLNQNNNHEQIILKNEEGVYVLTPSLNKSFKFQSDWPYNNSQIYLLQPIIDDVNDDKESKQEKKDEGYILTSKVNYSTETDYSKQKIYLDKEGNIIKIEVLDKSDNVKMSLNIIEIEYDIDFDKDYFSENAYINEMEKDKELEEDEVSKIDEVIYPMYVPTDTYLTAQNIVNTENGERAILNFTGESNFTIVQETLKDEQTLNYVYGDPYMILDTVGALTEDSVSWISNGIEYSVMSDTMDVDELLVVAQSISVEAISK